MKYIHKIIIPSMFAEDNILNSEKKTIFSTFYPFRVFEFRNRPIIDFEEITVLYGGNGTGKTTILNVVAQLCNATRHSAFSDTAFFDSYCSLCKLDFSKDRTSAHFLSSDDVFDYIMNVRYLNNGIDNRRNEIAEQYISARKSVMKEPDLRLHGIADYERWKNTVDAISKKSTESKYVKDRISKNIDMSSNGETSLKFFTEYIDRDALYIIDEPENSLSVDFQLILKKYIEDSARFYNCQFLISTHSPIFLSINNANVYEVSRENIEKKKWTELENVRKLFDFFESYRDEFTK